MTNITNRNSFNENVNEILSNSKHNDDMHALLFIDLDRFKQINETFGNEVGDQLLIEVANRINSLVKPYRFICKVRWRRVFISINEYAASEGSGPMFERHY